MTAIKLRCWTCRMFSRVGPGVRWCPRCGALNVWWCGPAQLGHVVTEKRPSRPPGPAVLTSHVGRRVARASTGEGHQAKRGDG